mmetsp:Transcript_677/g.954  ORF Transcript_677/g.954 Transcript_677/m.954 type:complete len:217 (+) Transcript_677:1-651(+)
MTIAILLLAFLAVCSTWLGSNAIKTSYQSSLRYRSKSRLGAIPPELVNPNYNLAAGSAVLGTVCGVLENLKGPTAKLFGGGAIAFTLFGGFIAFQTTTLRFQFDESNFSLVKADSSKIGENIVVGGENSWKYDSFVNWDFLPNEQFPILVYFKETQTPKEKWVQAPIVVDSIPGQAHFFPAIANVEELKEKFIKYNCKRATASETITLKSPTKLVL